jgi:hypothetical protein
MTRVKDKELAPKRLREWKHKDDIKISAYQNIW